jgi:hypothetical protein
LRELRGNCLRFHASVRQAYAGVQPAKNPNPSRGSILEDPGRQPRMEMPHGINRHPNVKLIVRYRAPKILACDADHGEGASIQPDSCANDRGIASEFPSP